MSVMSVEIDSDVRSESFSETASTQVKTKTLSDIFHTKRPIIGMIHFMPLLGYSGYSDIRLNLNNALKDLEALEVGGVDGIMFENNYDLPHKIFVGPETVACMNYLAQEIIQRTSLPVGVSVLWNDYKAALSIARICGARFVRLPVFVDSVRTIYGDVVGEPDEVIAYRRAIEAESVALFTDIHVKHATLLSNKKIEQSALEAIKCGADALIVTGKWTGDAPEMSDLQRVREAVADFPVLVGSGAAEDNIGLLARFADGVIVSTSLKTGQKGENEVNVKDYHQRLDKEKVIEFVRAFKEGTKA